MLIVRNIRNIFFSNVRSNLFISIILTCSDFFTIEFVHLSHFILYNKYKIPFSDIKHIAVCKTGR